MNDDLLDLERDLQALRPRPVPPHLMAGIAAGLAESRPANRRRSATSLTSWKWVNWGVAAALVAVMAAVSAPRPIRTDRPGPAPAAVAGYQPVAAERTIYAAADEGFVTLADGTPGRQLRSRYIDTITWQDPDSKASLRWSVPREEVQVLPLRYN